MEKYEELDIEVIAFESGDIITQSCTVDEGNITTPWLG